jgi:hypothetical protein
MADIDHFREYAKECLRLGKSVRRREVRRMLLEMASEFAAKAEFIEAAAERALIEARRLEEAGQEVDVRHLLADIAAESAARAELVEAAINEAMRDIANDKRKSRA